MQSPQLSIALYTRNTPGSYHWALVLSDGGIPSGVVDVHQITDAVKGQQTKGWRLDPRHVNLANSALFLGCVILPTSDVVDIETIRQFILQFPAEQGSYTTENNVHWSCARWIIRIIEDLVEIDIVKVEMEGFYRRVIARGMQLEAEKGKGNGGPGPVVPTVEF